MISVTTLTDDFIETITPPVGDDDVYVDNVQQHAVAKLELHVNKHGHKTWWCIVPKDYFEPTRMIGTWKRWIKPYMLNVRAAHYLQMALYGYSEREAKNYNPPDWWWCVDESTWPKDVDLSHWRSENAAGQVMYPSDHDMSGLTVIGAGRGNEYLHSVPALVDREACFNCGRVVPVKMLKHANWFGWAGNSKDWSIIKQSLQIDSYGNLKPDLCEHCAERAAAALSGLAKLAETAYEIQRRIRDEREKQKRDASNRAHLSDYSRSTKSADGSSGQHNFKGQTRTNYHDERSKHDNKGRARIRQSPKDRNDSSSDRTSRIRSR